MDIVMTETSQAADTRQMYRSAFRAFAEQARQVQHLTALTTTEDGRSAEAIDRLEQAVLEMERARLAYSQTRNQLAETLGSAPALPGDFSDAIDSSITAERVRSIANLLWEASGQPAGTAEEDWYRAERIVQRADFVTA